MQIIGSNFNKMAERRNGQLELKYDDLEYKLETKKLRKVPLIICWGL